ncbi:putative glycosyltransferase EpsJ [Aeoliella mucimassa]|uniref:Putative glycosyltransferase EpsJ n=2 Tax=Aeoliella mucimassa TaxID=2527972 RepID=A0A518AUT5_9BACT|nr:putative glycosyltransferase EpsJ [Aeoliella mucimassa]
MSNELDNLPLISVIIPVYENARDLEICLSTLAAQTIPPSNFEVIVVDNGSKDPPKSLVANYPFARFGSETKPGSYAARNTGLQLARASLLAFTDSDCQPHPTWLEKGIDALRDADKVDVVAGRIDVSAKDERKPTLAELYDMATRFDQKDRVARENGVVTANMLTRRDVFDRAGPFDDSLMSGADGLWSQHAADVGFKVVYVDDVPVTHPARASIAQICQQNSRFAHGRFDIVTSERKRSPLFWLRIAIRKILPRFQGTGKMYQRLRKRGYGFWSWIKVCMVLQRIHYSATCSQVARLFGGKSARR